MVHFNDLVIKRMIMHTINAKTAIQEHATTEYSDRLIVADEEVLLVLKTRLADAAGKNSKAFELEFANSDGGEFYALCHNLKLKSEEEFHSATKEMVDLLAEKQTRSNIPGGYLIFLDCYDEVVENSYYIVIKAEPHEALQQAEGQAQISLLKKVFLSPSQKLYKIGIVYEKENPISEAPNDLYSCFLFDDQFRMVSHPAEYFYKDFLGFSIKNNAKIQSKKFYDKTESFIKAHITDLSQKSDLLSALRVEFSANQNPIISPHSFSETYFDDIELIDLYQSEVESQLPLSIAKDATLLKSSLNRRKINFPANINITGPSEGFEQHVQFLSESDIGDIDFGENFSIVKITGKPYSND